jgi:hypothetical protein
MRSYRVQRHYGRWSLSLVVSLSVLLPTQSSSREPDTRVVQAAQASVSCSDTALGNNCGHCSHALLLSSQTRCMWPYQDPALIHPRIVAFFTQCELTDGCFDTTCWTHPARPKLQMRFSGKSMLMIRHIWNQLPWYVHSTLTVITVKFRFHSQNKIKHNQC